ncbi:MAG TPA: VOC family protein [Xanthomonadales bacterium]|nr:VOC family protein [Xanthomonadales bacterium]
MISSALSLFPCALCENALALALTLHLSDEAEAAHNRGSGRKEVVMGRVMHFEIHAERPERAIAFYEAVFAWTFERWDGPWPYWIVKTGAEGTPGINGGLMQRQGPAPVAGAACNAYPCTVVVDDLAAATARVERAGGKQVVERMTVPGVGFLAYFNDTEGNIFGVLQNDAKAGH